MAWRLAFILWSGEAELGINCYYLVNNRGQSMIAIGDDELYALRNRIDNYKIYKSREVKEIYSPSYAYKAPKFETKLRLVTEDYFDTRDLLIEMYRPSVAVNKFANGLSLTDTIKYELNKLLSGNNSYSNRGYTLDKVRWLINQAITYQKS